MFIKRRLTRRSFNRLVVGGAACPLFEFTSKGLWAAESGLNVTPREIAYLMADEARRPDSTTIKLENGRPGPKRFWVENWRDPQRDFEWTAHVEQSGEYEATLMVSAPPGTRLIVEGPRNQVPFETTQPSYWGYYWDRITLPVPLELTDGENQIRIRLLKPVTEGRTGAALKSIELLKASARPEFDARIRTFKSNASWLSDAKFGLMCQCGEWSFPSHGPHKPWPEFADRFDVAKFASMVDSTGAGYVIWSATWATYYFPGPIHAIDQIMPGRTSTRDLIGEMAEALAKKNIKLMLYYHVGHEVNAANGSWWSKNWMSSSDKSLFVNNWCNIVQEVGQRYGDRLAGWLFDDDLVYYPAPYERLGKAAKAGSRSRIISYNPWIQPRGTDFQDFQFGEGFRGSPDLPSSAHGIWPSGPQKALQAHGNFQVDGPDWGINKEDEKITPPFFTVERATEFALVAAEHNEALSWNLEMYEDGSVSEQSLSILQQVGANVRRRYPRKQGR